MKKYLVVCLLSFAILVGCGESNKDSKSINDNSSSKIEESREPFVAESYSTGIPFDSFVRSPEENKGNKTMFVAKVFQVIQPENGDNLVQYMATVTPEKDKLITVMLTKKKEELGDNIIENDEIRVWVKSLGTIDYETTSGSNNSVPAFYIDGYTIV